MKNTGTVDVPDGLAHVARTELAEAGGGSFRTPEYSTLRPRDLRHLLLHAPVAALSLLGLLGFYLKFEMMGPQWPLAARLCGKTDNYLSGFERLGFYFDDLLINFILVPAAGALLACLMSRSLRTIFFTAAAIATALLYFFQLRAYSQVGQYVSAPLLAESFSWAIGNPGAMGDYLSLRAIFKLAGLLLFLVFLLFGEHFRQAPPKSGFRTRLARWHKLSVVLLALGIPLTALFLLPVSYAYYPQGVYLHKSAVERVMTALVGTEKGSSLKFNLPLTDILEEFRRQTATPPLDESAPRVGSERGADLLLFVMETAPARILDLIEAGRELPGVGRLYDRSFLAGEHFSTYPYTSDALYSLLSGHYPQGRRRLLATEAVRQLPGLMSALDSGEYVRGIYAPDLYGAEMDDRMYRTFGADKTYYAAEHPGGDARAKAVARTDRFMAELEDFRQPFDPPARQKLTERLALDLQALAQLKADIVDIKQSGRRFCALFLPQIGHGPWIDLYNRPEVAARGHDLALLQDQWLAEILDLLASRGWLDNTIVVFTADHGIRTRTEDPGLPLGKLDAYMLQVPLLIYAPRALRQPAVLTAPTSHIDIAPTLLALLGKTSGTRFMEGIPVWQRSEAGRIYLLGSQYAGADGFSQNGAYFMHHLLSDAAFVNDRLAFDEDNMLPPDDGRTGFVRTSMRQGTDLQLSIVRRLVMDGYFATASRTGVESHVGDD